MNRWQNDTTEKLADKAQALFDAERACNGVTYDAGGFFVGFVKDRDGRAAFVASDALQWRVEAAVEKAAEWLAR